MLPEWAARPATRGLSWKAKGQLETAYAPEDCPTTVIPEEVRCDYQSWAPDSKPILALQGFHGIVAQSSGLG